MSEESTMEVTIEQGTLRGLEIDGLRRWRGIPYAAAPVGPLRWRAPQPGPHWEGTRDASAFGAHALQPPETRPSRVLAPDEDCLFLNVCAPAGAAPAGGWPVLVWIHGGGYRGGSGEGFGEGEAFAEA